MRPFLLSFFLSLSLFPFSSFFPSPPHWFDRSRGMQRAIYNASVFGSISEENYHRSLWEPSVYGFFPSSFLFVSAIHILSAVRNEQSFFLFNELVSAVFVFCTHLSCLFDKVSNSYRPYPSVERAWFYLHPCWTARPIFGRDDNFKRLPSRVLAGTINGIPQRAAGSINKLLLLYSTGYISLIFHVILFFRGFWYRNLPATLGASVNLEINGLNFTYTQEQ